ncbi:MAG TPA: trimethylamine methyltransferase family protein, partial [Candidatus Sumerlaeota bacterium]|nr:trimethylamine methyltransferase family protein [Candidatus Sumerlaeota bacterium]
GGVFLTHPHTAIESRRNFWASELFDRNTYDSWLARGGRDIIEIATEKARAILATHHPRPLSEEQMAAMEDICERAKAEILQGQRSRTSGTREPASAM